jgi:hypothetical protein
MFRASFPCACATIWSSGKWGIARIAVALIALFLALL